MPRKAMAYIQVVIDGARWRWSWPWLMPMVTQWHGGKVTKQIWVRSDIINKNYSASMVCLTIFPEEADLFAPVCFEFLSA